MKKRINLIMSIFLLSSIVLTTIVYSAFSTQMQITGEALVRSDNDIRITDLKVIEQNNGAYETYNNKYTKDTTSIFATLPSNSSISYQIEITNKSNVDYVLNEEILSNTNVNISYNSSQKKYDIYKANSVSNITISLTNNTTEEQLETLVLKYIFAKAEATFIPGPDFNKKVKTMMGLTEPVLSTPETNITSFKRATSLPNIELTDANLYSTEDSTIPIYLWYNSGILYYFTAVEKPYLNNDSSHMWREFSEITTIELDSVDTTRVQLMNLMFYDCYKLKSLDLSNFNTDNVYTMRHMFCNCYELATLDISSFNTSKVTDMQYMFHECRLLSNLSITHFNTSKVSEFHSMFYGCKSLTSLDLSSFDLSNTTNTSLMISNMPVLTKLKTPKAYPIDTTLTIALPNTFYDASNNSYTSLTNASPKATWLNVK